MRVTASAPSQVPSAQVQAALQEVLLIEPKPTQQPYWCKVICRHRDEVKNSVVLVSSPLGVQAFLVLSAMQNPLVAGFLRLTSTPSVLSPSLLRQGLLQILEAQWAFCWEVHWGSVVLSKDLPRAPPTSVSVVPHAVIKGDKFVSDAFATPLLKFLPDNGPSGAPPDEASDSGPSAQAAEPGLVKHKWLGKYLNTQAGASGEADDAHGAGGGDRNRPSVRVAEMEEDEVEVAFAELELQREELRQDIQLTGEDFKTDVLRGAWTKGNKAVAGDRVKCWGSNKDAKAFADKFFNAKEVSYAFGLYTQRGCAACASLWCRRL